MLGRIAYCALAVEVVQRARAVGLTDYTAVVFPKLTPVWGSAGEIVDIEISYPMDLMHQMFYYKQYFEEEEEEAVEVAVL